MRRQRGIALITAMLIVAIVATVAAYLSMGQALWMRQSENTFAIAQADSVSTGALGLATVLIAQDRNAATDHAGEIWAKPLPPFPVGQGSVTAKIDDAQGRFNLNNLAANPVNNDDRKIFMALLQQLGLDRALIHAVIDWVDGDHTTTGASGAEDDYYLALPAPYRAANRRLESVDELRLIRGFDAKAVQALRPFVTVLPVRDAAINANTAPAQVLAVLFSPPLDLAAAEAIAATRPAAGKGANANAQEFKTCSDLAARAPGRTLIAARCTVKTDYFEFMVAARFGRLTRTTQALFARQGNAAGGAADGAQGTPSASAAPAILWTRNFVVKDIRLEKQNR